MNDSVPIEIIKLGLNFYDYYGGIAQNVNRVLEMKNKWGNIIKRANEELPKWVSEIGPKIPRAMCYDRGFFNAAGLKYGGGPPSYDCFTVAVSDYLLRNQDRLKETELIEATLFDTELIISRDDQNKLLRLT